MEKEKRAENERESPHLFDLFKTSNSSPSLSLLFLLLSSFCFKNGRKGFEILSTRSFPITRLSGKKRATNKGKRVVPNFIFFVFLVFQVPCLTKKVISPIR